MRILQKRLTVLLFVCVFAAAVLPVRADPVMRISADNVCAQAGSVAEVSIMLTDNPGLVSLKITVTFDPALTLLSVSDAGVLGNHSHKPERQTPYTLSWANDTARTNFSPQGTIATLRFWVPEHAKNGAVYPITLFCDPDNYEAYDMDINCIPLTVEGGSITAISENTGGSAEFEYYFNETGLTVSRYTGSDPVVTVDGFATVDGITAPVTAIDDFAFEGTNVVKIILPDSVTVFSELAFWGCEDATLLCERGTETARTLRTVDMEVRYPWSGEYNAVSLAQLCQGLLGSDFFDEGADTNGDSDINILDLIRLKKLLAA